MLTELLLIDRNLTFGDLDELAKYSGEVNKICAPTSLLPFLQGINREKITALIDFPYGLASTKTRLYEISYASTFASSVDIPLNSIMVSNWYADEIFVDLQACISACICNKLAIRVILEYSIYPVALKPLSEMLGVLNIDAIVTTTGVLPTSSRDELLVARDLLLETRMPVYSCNIFSKDIIEQFKRIGISGLRFSSINFYKNVKSLLKGGV